MATVPFHNHTFDIPTADAAEIEAGIEPGKVITPAELAPVLATRATTTELAGKIARTSPQTASGILFDGTIFATDFREQAIASGVPVGWASQWTTDYTVSVQADSDGLTGKSLRFHKTVENNGFIAFTPVGQVADVEVVARIRLTAIPSGTHTLGGVVVRGSGAATTENGYTFGPRATSSAGTQALRNRLTAGASSGVTSTFAWAADTTYYLRVRASGDEQKYKIWLASDAEPAAWTLEETNAVHASGYVGLYMNDDAADLECDFFSVALNGETAPLATSVLTTRRPILETGVTLIDQSDQSKAVNLALRGNEVYAAGQETLSAPYLMPSLYSGNVTLSPSDNWRRVIQNYNGDGTIYLGDGLYDIGGGASDTLLIGGRRRTRIEAVNAGLAEIKGMMTGYSQTISLNKVKITQYAGRRCFFIHGCYFEMVDCDVDASAISTNHFIQAYHSAVHFAAVGRDSTWTFGASMGEGFDIDLGCGLKVAGSSGFKVKMNFDAGSSIVNVFALDTAKCLFAGTEFTDASGNLNLTDLRRCSTLELQSDNLIDGFARGLYARGGGYINILSSGTTIQNCTVAGIRTSVGGKCDYHPSTVFTSNAQNVVDDKDLTTIMAGTNYPAANHKITTKTTASGTVTISPYDGYRTYRYGTTLTGDLTVNFDSTSAKNGHVLKVIAPASLGGFTMTVNGVSITANQWIEWVFETGTTWRQIGNGTLI